MVSARDLRALKWQPTQCSCLENPRDGGARWAAIYRVCTVRHN